jgi:hypothetical protein
MSVPTPSAVPNIVGGAVPNRGSDGQLDISIFGLSYLQRIADAVTNEALHIEPGFWLNVPPTTVPAGAATVVRQGRDFLDRDRSAVEW